MEKDYGVPLISGTSFISGIGVEKAEAAILGILNADDKFSLT